MSLSFLSGPITKTFRTSNSGLIFAMYPSSVVQTGVKSFGCENSTAHESPIHSWKWIFPSVVSASKSGAVSPIWSAMSVPPVAVWRENVVLLATRGKRAALEAPAVVGIVALRPRLPQPPDRERTQARERRQREQEPGVDQSGCEPEDERGRHRG